MCAIDHRVLETSVKAADCETSVIVYGIFIEHIYWTKPWQLLILTPIRTKNQQRLEVYRRNGDLILTDNHKNQGIKDEDDFHSHTETKMIHTRNQRGIMQE